ncbi:MAG: TonB-dependent receptor [Gemmatimonadota bacterium]
MVRKFILALGRARRCSPGGGAALILLCAFGSAAAQEPGRLIGTVSETVSGTPRASVAVEVEGLGLSALTGADGSYAIDDIPPGMIEVRVSVLGYAPLTRAILIEAGSTAVADFSLRISPVSLDALIVTATGLQRRREIGNATTTLEAGRLMEVAAPTTLTQLLQGRAPGVQVRQSSGTVGTASSIKIRGNTSIGLDNTPLIYIDGARISNETLSGPQIGGQTTSRLNDLTLEDIESIEIVRGPSAATLYGTEAAAGVIRVTTKRGRTGASEWTFRSELAGSWDDTDWPDVVFNPALFFGPEADTLYRMNLLRDGTAGEGTFGTPWRTGIDQSYGASLRGGTEGTTYYLSGELGRREGTLPNNGSTRRSVRGNLNLHPSENVDVAVSTSFGSTAVQLPLNDNTTDGYIAAALVGFAWDMPITRDDPVTGETGIQTCALHYEASRALNTPISSIPFLGLPPCAETPFFSGHTFEDVASVENTQEVERFTGSVTVDYRPRSFLTASGTLGYDQFSDQTGTFYPVDPSLTFGDLSLGARSINHVVSRNLSLEGYLAASFDLSSTVYSTTSLGAQFFRTRTEIAGAIGRIFPAGPTNVSNALRTEGSESFLENRILGFYLQQQFAYRDRLFLTPAIRVDESSAFGPNLGPKVYPRVMTAYVISEEGWFPEGIFESLRLRMAWGRSGKQPESLDALQLLEIRRTALRDQDAAGVSYEGPGNPDLKPETGTELELGWEGELAEGRVGVDFTWYRQTTRDAIVRRSLPPSSGFPESVATNIGEIRNQGMELALYGLVWEAPSLRWDWQLTAATNRGRITRLEDPINFGVDLRAQRHQQGLPFGAYFSREYVIGEGGEVEATEEPVYMGHPTPEYEGSISTTVTLFDRITLHADLGFAGGHQQFNSTEEFRCGIFGGGEYGGTCDAIFARGPDGEPTDEARRKVAAATDTEFGPWIEDADFARLRTLSLRLEVPDGWVSALGASRASVTLAGENLALFTKYSGLDPEVNAAGGQQDIRVDFLTLPPAKRIASWISITF